MEANHNWHAKVPTQTELDDAVAELAQAAGKLVAAVRGGTAPEEAAAQAAGATRQAPGLVARNAPDLAPELFGADSDAAAARQVALSMGRALWNALPQPDNNYRPRPLPKPQAPAQG